MPITPGIILEYEVPDMYDRPWDTIWRENFEQDMRHPEEGQDIIRTEYEIFDIDAADDLNLFSASVAWRF